MDDVKETGTYQMYVATHGGATIVEARARRMAREAGSGQHWEEYVMSAKEQLLTEAGIDPNSVPTS